MIPNTLRSALTLGQLRIHAESLGMSGYRSMSRADLVDAIRAAEAKKSKAEAAEAHRVSIELILMGARNEP